MRLMDSSLSINIIRGMVLAICIAIGMIIAKSFEAGAHLGATVGACYGAFLIILDHLLRYFTFRGFSHGTIGLMVGLFCAWLILRVNFFDNIWFRGIGNHETIENVIKLTVYTGLGFLGTMLALLLMWFGISTPLVFVGAFFGFKAPSGINSMTAMSAPSPFLHPSFMIRV